MENIQFVQTSPEQFRDDLLIKISDLIEKLKEDFKPKQMEEYLTRTEVAELLKINISTLHNWCNSGILTKYAIGNRIYFKRSDVEKSLIQINNNEKI